MKNYYQILNVPESANADAIKTAYRLLVKQYHPDRNPGNGKAEETMKLVNEAYEVLCEPEKKQAYDRALLQQRQAEAERQRKAQPKQQTPEHAPTATSGGDVAVLIILFAILGWALAPKRKKAA